MIRRLLLPGLIIAVLAAGGCVKETYDMKKLSKKAHLSPTFAVSAVKGEISLEDIIKANDTVVFDQDNLVKIVFRIDTVLDLTMSDFIFSKSMAGFMEVDSVQSVPFQVNTALDTGKGYIGQGSAAFVSDTVYFDIKEILDHITGTFSISNPSIVVNYSNSFTNPIELDLNLTGIRNDEIVELNLAPISLLYPVAPTDPEVKASFRIDKSNSSLPELMSLPPEKISIGGTAIMNIPEKKSMQTEYLLGSERLTGSLEVEVPLELRMNNLQFTDTIDNFMIDKDSGSDNPIKPENFELLRIDIEAVNGFPLGASMSMSLYNPLSRLIIETVEATDIIKPAQIDSNGKVTTPAESTTSIEFTKDFFNEINNADQIIFSFKLNTTNNGTSDVSIYSDYMIKFKAALVLKPDITVDL